MASSRRITYHGGNALNDAEQTIQGERGSGSRFEIKYWSDLSMIPFSGNPQKHQDVIDLVDTPKSLNPDLLIPPVDLMTTNETGLEGLFDPSLCKGHEAQKKIRKRMTDKKYRDQCKKHKMTMEQELEKLRIENAVVRSENDALKRGDKEMKEKLFCQGEKMKKLKEDFNELKSKYEMQDSIVQALSRHVGDDLQLLETQKLKEENALLKQNANLNNQSSKIAEMQLKIKMLQVQINALCGSILNEKQKNFS